LRWRRIENREFKFLDDSCEAWNSLQFRNQSYDRELQRQRCKNLKRHV
jgi:hypothetical protein